MIKVRSSGELRGPGLRELTSTGGILKVALHTLGCKLNYAETSTIGKQFLDRGFELVEFGLPADVVVINTCTVTERAARECRQIIRRALRSSSSPYVVVTGCYAQLEPEAIASIDGVDLVLGAREKFDLFRFAGRLSKEHTPRIHVSDIDSVDNFGPAFTTEAGGRTRAYLKVQDGCDYSCSFCTIPMARGASRSQSIDQCVSQAGDLAREGYREIVLTGVNVGDYGKKSGDSLLALVRGLTGVTEIERIRISSIEPNLLTPEIIDSVAREPKLCKHFHIPLQSGSDDVLRLMRRRYSTGDYRALIRRIREVIPEAGIGADVIVGFPGETGAHFDATYAFLHELPLSYLHVFTYSERPNTPAASMGEPVVPEMRHKRNKMLRILSQKKRRAFYESMVGSVMTVLTEGDVEDGKRFGFTDNYVRVSVPAGMCEDNVLLPVVITGVDDNICVGMPLRGVMPA
jgi:threonylcarbamoyladenosine tRNA methylthiotransferase MtaB